jgi:beta-lactamase class A
MLSKRLSTAATVLVALALSFAAPADTDSGRRRETRLAPEPALQRSLRGALAELNLNHFVAQRQLAVSLVDVTDMSHPRYAGINDTEMMYAASLPKICALVAGFERIHDGTLAYTADVKDMFTRMIRYSSNADASKVIQKVGFEYISKVLMGPKYHFYDVTQNGGLWLGKGYGGPSDYWKRDPLHHLSHGATTWQVARFFMLLEQGRLVSPEYSAEMKEILSKPGIHHKFVKGLEGSGCEIYRKSGTWSKFHADGALIEHGDKKYIAVALMENEHGAEVFPKLIQKMDALIVNE